MQMLARRTGESGSGNPRRGGRPPGGLALALAGALLAVSAGCQTHTRDLGFESTRLEGSRVETSSGPAVGWPVTVVVEGREVGTWPTDAQGDVRVNLKNYLPKLSRQGVLRVEYRIRTPEGAVEVRRFDLTPEQFAQAPR